LHNGDLDQLKRNEGWPSSTLVDALPHFINDMLDEPDSYGWNVWVVRSEGVIIGDCGFKSRPDEDGSVEIGFSIVPSERSNGYAEEALNALIKWAFENTVREIIAEVSKGNIPSSNLLLKIGFEQFEENDKMDYFKLN